MSPSLGLFRHTFNYHCCCPRASFLFTVSGTVHNVEDPALLDSELGADAETSVVSMPKPGIVCLHSRRPSDSSTRQFVFDHTFWSCTRDTCLTNTPFSDQVDVYKALAFPLLMRALEGYNACLFAYGMTSSGKTFSITGPPENPGIIPRMVDDLFTQVGVRQSAECAYAVEMSYFEIYNERIRDLLSDRTGQTSGLSVREHPTTGPYVEGLCRMGVRSKTDVMGWLRVGNRQRTVAATTWNEQSSRSHTVFTLFLTRRTVAKYPFGDMIENVYTSQINVVDLAGSERQMSSKPLNERLHESCHINKSLFNLGKVISQLARNNAPKMDLIPPKTDPRGRAKLKEPLEWYTPSRLASKKSGYVSYRDSVLTWLLRDSLGGNAMTAMLATISPSARHMEETLATLNYAKKAQSIVNNAVINEDPQGRVIRQLIAEVNRLRQESSVRCEPGSPQAFEVARLREVLVARENEVRELSRQLAERSFGTQTASPAQASCDSVSTVVPVSSGSTRAPLVVDQMTSPIMFASPLNFHSVTRFATLIRTTIIITLAWQ
ncbi:Kinesin protein [Fasciolopsis buskii]|uniref:Kinesin-like protein n=1 Tax=Fasciolopsis buskii TaxID=27845 RepID=A0A8E0RVP5_9TREM|nr:Kinesin protein [Fasciolopsis buski]